MGAAAGKGLVGEKARIVGHFVACLADYEAAGHPLPPDGDESLPNFKRRLYASVEQFGAKHAGGGAQTSSSLVLSLQSLSQGDLSALQQYIRKRHIVEAPAASAPASQHPAQPAFPSLLPAATRETEGDVDDNTSVLSYGDDDNEQDEATDFFESSHSPSPSLAGSMLIEDRDSLRGSVASLHSLHSTQSLVSTSSSNSHSHARSVRAGPGSPAGSDEGKAFRLPVFETKGGWRSAMESSDAVLQGLSSKPYLSSSSSAAAPTPSGGRYPDAGEAIDARNEALMGLQVRWAGCA